MSEFSITIECPQCKMDVAVPSKSIFHYNVTHYCRDDLDRAVFIYLCPTCDKDHTEPSPFESKIIPEAMLTDEQKTDIMQHRNIQIGLE